MPGDGELEEETVCFACYCLAATRERRMGKTAKVDGNAGKKKTSTRVRLDDLTDVHDRCAGIDVHKQSVTVCISTGDGQGELREYPTTTSALRELKEWFRQMSVTHVVMESTGI